MPSPRPFVLPALLTLAAGAMAQTAWQGDFDRPVRRDTAELRAKEAPRPLSPNIIVGEVLRVEAGGAIAIVRLDALPSDPEATLTARDADCTPRALLRPLREARRSPILRARVTHGLARAGQEVVLPAEELLKNCHATLPSREKTPAAPKTPTAPATTTTSAKTTPPTVR